MLTSEDIKLLSQLMDEKLKPINERLDTIEENTEITRVATNEVIKWIDKYFRDDYPFPADDKQAIYEVPRVFGVFLLFVILKVNFQNICYILEYYHFRGVDCNNIPTDIKTAP